MATADDDTDICRRHRVKSVGKWRAVHRPVALTRWRQKWRRRTRVWVHARYSKESLYDSQHDDVQMTFYLNDDNMVQV